MSETPENTEKQKTHRMLRFDERGGKGERKPCHCRPGAIAAYDPWLDARADELEALRCLVYLIRNDARHPERMSSYLDEVDYVLDRMVHALKLCA